jgi:hypothetical protein
VGVSGVKVTEIVGVSGVRVGETVTVGVQAQL